MTYPRFSNTAMIQGGWAYVFYVGREKDRCRQGEKGTFKCYKHELFLLGVSSGGGEIPDYLKNKNDFHFIDIYTSSSKGNDLNISLGRYKVQVSARCDELFLFLRTENSTRVWERSPVSAMLGFQPQ